MYIPCTNQDRRPDFTISQSIHINNVKKRGVVCGDFVQFLYIRHICGDFVQRLFFCHLNSKKLSFSPNIRTLNEHFFTNIISICCQKHYWNKMNEYMHLICCIVSFYYADPLKAWKVWINFFVTYTKRPY